MIPYLLQHPICNSNPIKFITDPGGILAVITPPDSVRETILVDVSYVNYDRLGLIYVIGTCNNGACNDGRA